jgi:hypothetical protein
MIPGRGKGQTIFVSEDTVNRTATPAGLKRACFCGQTQDTERFLSTTSG